MTVRNPVLLLCERLKINSLKSSFSSAREISAISLRVSPSVLKELCQQSNVSFRFRHCVLAFLFFNKRLNGAFQRSIPWTSHVGLKSRSETRGPRLSVHQWIFVVCVCDWVNDVFSPVKIHRSRLLLANGFNVLVLSYRFFGKKSQYLWSMIKIQYNTAH